jgi:hypothetical protein
MIYRACVGELEQRVRLVDLLEVRLQEATGDAAAEHPRCVGGGGKREYIRSGTP